MRHRQGAMVASLPNGTEKVEKKRVSRRSILIYVVLALVVLMLILIKLENFLPKAAVYGDTHHPSSKEWVLDDSITTMSRRTVVDMSLRLIKSDLHEEGGWKKLLQRGNFDSRHKSERQRVLRCALVPAPSAAACASQLMEVVDSVDMWSEEENAANDFTFLLPSEAHYSQGHGRDQITSFLQGSSAEIMTALPEKIVGMKAKAVENGLQYPKSSALHAAVLAADAAPHRVFNSPQENETANRTGVNAFLQATSDVQVLGSLYLMQALGASLTLVEDLTAVLQASKITYIVFDHELHPQSSLFMDSIRRSVEVSGCAHKLTSGDDGASLCETGLTMVRLSCPSAHGTRWTPKSAKDASWVAVEAAAVRNGEILSSAKTVPVPQPPLLCEHMQQPIPLLRVMKYGTKGAIFASSWAGEDAVVKVLHPYQYFSFQGFGAFIGNSTQRTPLVHYPLFSCYSEKYDAIFQVQPFLNGYFQMQSALTSRKAESPFSFKERVEIAIQIVCIFHFLHTKSPGGFFTYDDNHPAQYMLKKKTDGSYAVRLTDIDTLQLAEPLSKAVPLKPLVYPYSNVSTRCRCFYCAGRSNCVFVNTREAFSACGQLSDARAWSLEISSIAKPGRNCDGSSDVWFEAQLLYLLFENKFAWKGEDRAKLLAKLESGKPPSFKDSGIERESDKKEVRLLIEQMFNSRPAESAILQKLEAICRRIGCRQTECPALSNIAPRSYSSPLLIPIQ